MNNLFIIGNGFDISHGLKTSYNNFRNYLIKSTNYNGLEGSLITPERKQLPDGSFHYDEEEVINMLLHLIDQQNNMIGQWNKVESILPDLNFDDAFSLSTVKESNGETDLFKTAYNNEDIARDLVIPTKSLNKLFSDWINSIVLHDAKHNTKFQSIINSNDVFLNFNYTETLEKIYDIPTNRICHIHGKQNSKIYFGHGNKNDYTDRYMGKYTGAEDHLSEMYRSLYKDTDSALQNNVTFFEDLTKLNIQNIYTFGFSFNAIDKIYLQEISQRIETSTVTCFFNDYDKKKHNNYKKAMRECGFEGAFDTFSA